MTHEHANGTEHAARSSPPDIRAAERVEAMRARVLAGSQLVSAAAFTLAFVSNRPPGLEGAKNATVFPFFAAVSLALYLLQRRSPQHFTRWAWLTFGVFCAYLVGDLAFYLFWFSRVTTADIRVIILALLPWIPVMNPLAFVILPSRHAVRASAVYSAVQAVLVGVFLLTRHGAPDPILTSALTQQFVLVPVMYIVLLRYTASVAEAFAEARVASHRFEELALTDELTELPNRRATRHALVKAMSHHRRSVLGVGVVIIDIDHFKRVNDRYGHEVGDVALKHVARVLAEVTRKSETVGRWGGEEFLVVLSSKPPIAMEIAVERIRAAVANAPLKDPPLKMTVSLGAALAGPEETIESMLQRADAALYEAKAAGRDRAVVARMPEPGPSPGS